jgi:hypothetical protein
MGTISSGTGSTWSAIGTMGDFLKTLLDPILAQDNDEHDAAD